ncbi:MAG TPA: hypothetical protein VF980_05425 [Thermoanaerobaculia bacterium]
MKRAAAILILLLTGATAVAQEQPQNEPKPDYSREKLIQIFANEPVKEPVEPRMQLGFGYVDFKALRMRWRIAYLPILMPLSGSVPWASNRAFGNLPDPFAATGTEIAYGPRTWRDMRDMNAELKRIERTEKVRAKVTVNPE